MFDKINSFHYYAIFRFNCSETITSNIIITTGNNEPITTTKQQKKVFDFFSCLVYN